MSAPAWKKAPPHNAVQQPEREIIRVTSDTPRSEIAALLLMANDDTKRLPNVIEKFSANRDHWTPWSDAHDYLNDLLYDWELAPA